MYTTVEAGNKYIYLAPKVRYTMGDLRFTGHYVFNELY